MGYNRYLDELKYSYERDQEKVKQHAMNYGRSALTLGELINEDRYLDGTDSEEDHIRRECERMDYEEQLQRQGMSEWGDGTPLPPDEGIETVVEPG